MGAVADFRERVAKAFSPNSRGVLGLVEELLKLANEEGLSLDWHAGRCCVRTLSGSSDASMDFALAKSVFRAVLAHIAAICNERRPNAVSPYGGEGELALSNESPVLRASFVNRPGELRLEIRSADGAQ